MKATRLRPRYLRALPFLGVFAVAAARGTILPTGFQDTIVFSGLTNPTAVRFAPDGRVFVAEKSGLIKVFDDLSDPTPTVFADLRTNVHNYWDRGLLGIALDPNFPKSPYVYVLYTYDAPIGGKAPTWGTVGGTFDGCPNPPGATQGGCVVSGRLSRLQAAGNVMTGTEQVMIEDWCQQFPSHSVGSLQFGPDGKLYVSGGEGANFVSADYGQFGGTQGTNVPRNPCGDPPSGVGGPQSPPTAEGGALRAQDLRTPSDPVGLNGTILRIDPATGAGLADNPLGASPDANARRIVGYGLRNPFRFTIKPGTSEIWIGDVGWFDWEEIDRISSPTGPLRNFGWPCYEGFGSQPSYDGLNLDICEDLYFEGSVTPPVFAYDHNESVVPADGCSTGSSAIAGMAFYDTGNYPSSYQGALFFADYSRKCMWVMFPGIGGDPDPANRAAFASAVAAPVDLQIGPGGDLYYADLDGGTIRRIRYLRPTAVADANPRYGLLPLTVNFDGSGSQPAIPSDVLTYAWDLDGDGQFNDSGAVQPSRMYSVAGNYQVRLKVTDQNGMFDISQPITISAGNTPPTANISSPAPGTTWKVGDVIQFSGNATDPQQGALPPAALSWSLVLQHCPSNCHEHPLQGFPGVASGSFAAPDHDYPSHLELRLTATDAGGLSDTRSLLLFPQTTTLSFQSSPSGLQLVVGSESSATPFNRTVIVGSATLIAAPSPQAVGGVSYQFLGWSDGGDAAHTFTANASPTTLTATFGTGFGFYTLAPCRVVDTRLAPGALGGPALSAGAMRTFPIAGACGIPASAKAVSLNVTVTESNAGGHVTLFASGAAIPLASTINYRAAQTRANNAIVPINASGISAASGQPAGTVQLVIDVNGYFE